MTRVRGATGIGSWPGTDVAEALAVVRGELASSGEDTPYLPELPARGPGADLVGRGAGLLVEMPVDLQPSGWRLVDRPGRDLARTMAMVREDRDRLAEAFDGYEGPLKVQVCGPWTLAASLELTRGERAVSDHGARRDLVESLAEGVRGYVADVRRLVPGAQVVLQVDEPSVGAVLDGRLPTVSGYGRLRAVPEHEVRDGLSAVLGAARAAGAGTAVHSCAAAPPLATFVAAGADALAVDLSLLTAEGLDALAAAVESGRGLVAGVVPTAGALPSPDLVADAVVRPWRAVGLEAGRLRGVAVSATCGLAGSSPDHARASLVLARRAAERLREVAQD